MRKKLIAHISIKSKLVTMLFIVIFLLICLSYNIIISSVHIKRHINTLKLTHDEILALVDLNLGISMQETKFLEGFIGLQDASRQIKSFEKKMEKSRSDLVVAMKALQKSQYTEDAALGFENLKFLDKSYAELEGYINKVLQLKEEGKINEAYDIIENSLKPVLEVIYFDSISSQIFRKLTEVDMAGFEVIKDIKVMPWIADESMLELDNIKENLRLFMLAQKSFSSILQMTNEILVYLYFGKEENKAHSRILKAQAAQRFVDLVELLYLKQEYFKQFEQHDKDEIFTFAEKISAFFSIAEQAIDKEATEKTAEAYLQTVGEFDKFLNVDIYPVMEHMLDHRSQEINASLSELLEITNSAVLKGMISLLVISFAVVFVTFRFIRGVLASIKKLHEGAKNFGRGNLSKRIELDSNDELGEFALFFNKMASDLQSLFVIVEKSKRQWEATMDCLSDMVLVVDNDNRIIRANKVFKNYSRFCWPEILNRDYLVLLRELGLYPIGIEKDGDRETTHIYHKASGHWYVYTVTPFAYDSANVHGRVITLHDATSLKMVTTRLEVKNKEIQESKNSLQVALDSLSALIQAAANEESLSVRFTNPNLKKCYEVQDCKSENCHLYGKQADRCWQKVGTYCGDTAQGDMVSKYTSCTNCPVFEMATEDPIYQIGEHFNNMMHILETKNNKLSDAYAELKATQSKILHQEKMASIGQLAAGVAHEINNPIGFVSSNLRTLEKYVAKLSEFIAIQSEALKSISVSGVDASESIKAVDASKKKLKLDYVIDDITSLIPESLEGADRVKMIVQNLKDFSRVDKAEYEYADINDCFQSTLNIVWNELKYKVTLHADYGDIPKIQCFPQQLNQVIMNLLVNAAHAIEKQGEVNIKTWQDEKHVCFSVSDNGCGIDPDNLNKIFDPFFTTKDVGKGTGLGLSITYDIVKKHNADITVDSEPGKGTTFTVSIPRVAA